MENGKENILVSIITVCYNSAKTIEGTLQSMLAQTFRQYEYLIIDGASRDNTLEIIKSYEPQFQGRLKWISEPDFGIYDAMNKGIQMAEGELIGIINSDDSYQPMALEVMVQRYRELQKEHVILYGFQRNMEGDKEKSVVLFHHMFLDDQMITHPTCFVSKSVYRDLGGFDTTYKSSADYEFMLRVFHDRRVHFEPVYEIIANFQTGGMSSSETGYRETARLQYQYHSISHFRYIRIIIKSLLYEFVHGRRRQ